MQIWILQRYLQIVLYLEALDHKSPGKDEEHAKKTLLHEPKKATATVEQKMRTSPKQNSEEACRDKSGWLKGFYGTP